MKTILLLLSLFIVGCAWADPQPPILRTVVTTNTLTSGTSGQVLTRAGAGGIGWSNAATSFPYTAITNPPWLTSSSNITLAQLPSAVVTNGAANVTLNYPFAWTTTPDGWSISVVTNMTDPLALGTLNTPWVSLSNSGILIGTTGEIYDQGGQSIITANTITGNNFTGNGSGLTNLAASGLTGTLPTSTLPAALATVSSNNAVNLTNVQASKLVGAFPPAVVLTNAVFYGTAAGTNWTFTDALGWHNTNSVTGGVVGIASGNVTASGTFTGNGGGLTNLPAANLTGTVPVGSLPSAVVTNLGAGGFTNTGACKIGASIIDASANAQFNSARIGAIGNAGCYVNYDGDGLFGARASGKYGFTAGTTGGGTFDAWISRAAAGNLQVNTNLTILGYVKFSGVTASNPPTSGAGTAFIFAATNAAGTAEIFTMDGAGVVKQISEHAMDAPDALIDDADEAPNISKEILFYTGKVRWINRSRAARMQELETKVALNRLDSYQTLTGKTPTQWTNSASYGKFTNSLFALDAMADAGRQVIMVESFAEYNTRLGLTNGNGLVKVKWSDVQTQIQNDYTNSYNAAMAAYQANPTNAVAPTWNPPAVQPMPSWLQKRGVQ